MSARSRSATLSRASQSLIALSESLSHSGSHVEDRYWYQLLGTALDKALGARHTRAVESALDVLLEERSPGYEILVEQAESHSESLPLQHEGRDWDALLISAPVLAWTRYQLPSAPLEATRLQALSVCLQATVLGPETRLCLMPDLVRFDRLPQSFQHTRHWTQALAQRALGQQRDWPVSPPPAEEQGDLLADAFFLMGVILVPHGEAAFRWQTPTGHSHEAQQALAAQWAEACAPILEPAFTGCQLEYLLPQSFYSSTRLADQQIRPMTLKAAATWLQTAAQIPGNELRAAMVACGDEAIEEYRIGFCTRQSNDVIYGCVWPSLSREESLPESLGEGQVDTWDTLAALLRECGIQDIRRLPGIQPLEFCEDCGTPYFPNMLGEMQHPELPEEIDPDPVQFH